MVAALLLALVSFQDRPAIQDIRTLTAGFARSGCWLPLKVRLTGPPGFEGEVVASADAGFRVVRPVRISPSGTSEVTLPVVILGRETKAEVVLRGPTGEMDRKLLPAPTFLGRELLVLLDPSHPETEAIRAQELKAADGRPLRFGVTDPSDWNELADMGAFEIVDAVVISDSRAAELTMREWQALGGAVLREPRRDLERIRDGSPKFPAIDPAVARFVVGETWIPQKRDTAQLFIVIYGFAFFVVVFATWARKGGPWLLMASAAGVAAVFIAGYSALYPTGSLAVKYWQGLVEAPEEKVAISISALWGNGRVDEVRFGRIVKPVHATMNEAGRRDLEMRRTDEGRWIIRGTEPGDPTRFVTVDRIAALEPHRQFGNFRQGESEYYLRVGRKEAIRLQDPKTAAPPPIEAEGLIEVAPARVFRVVAGNPK